MELKIELQYYSRLKHQLKNVLHKALQFRLGKLFKKLNSLKLI